MIYQQENNQTSNFIKDNTKAALSKESTKPRQVDTKLDELEASMNTLLENIQKARDDGKIEPELAAQKAIEFAVKYDAIVRNMANIIKEKDSLNDQQTSSEQPLESESVPLEYL